jgi:MFS superfamily sulfate permease-like transporter
MIFVGLGLGLIFGFAIGCALTLEDSADEAVAAGKAEYYLDENNERQWRWLP